MEDKWGLFQKFLITENAQITLVDFLINTGIIVILAVILEFTYAKCAKSLSNRKMFAANFMLIAFTTMLIINIVKSSLALSLGLVGALSIVRFRSAIKEPEELAYLFFTISIGLGLGAEQRTIVIVAFFVMILILWLRYFLSKKSENQNLYFTVSSLSPNKISLEQILSVVREAFSASELKRFDENQEVIEASFLVEIKETASLQKCADELKKLSETVKVTYIDNKSY
ncbi:MAG: DUF4956 domain-containing protein [Bacteroidia bacterium]|nr:MAG: DUF4956 domain-containing protein [Bacteroidia bacterium]